MLLHANSVSNPQSSPKLKAVLMGLIILSALIANVCGAETQALQIVQTNYFDTGFDGTGTPLLIPSTDPAGITYHEPSGHLFIADSEINELSTVFPSVGGNIFEVSLAGDTLFEIYDTTIEGNNEPTGITFNEFDGFFYMSNDDTRKIYRYSYSDTEGFAIDAEVSTLNTASAGDPEGLTSDPATGLLYVVDGVGKLLLVYSFEPRSLSLWLLSGLAIGGVLGMLASSAIVLRLRASLGSNRRQLARARVELDKLRADDAAATDSS